MFEKYGFALLVVAALACASYLAGTVAVPEPVPDFALRAAEIYRLEIGAAFFVAFYLATMALFLAFSGKGFAEFTATGLKIEEVVERATERQDKTALAWQLRIDHRTEEKLQQIQAFLDDLHQRQRLHEQRLEKLDEGR